MNHHDNKIIPVDGNPHGNHAMQLDHHGGGYGRGRGNAWLEEEEEPKFDILKLFWIAVHYRTLIAAILVTILICGTIVNFLMTPYYLATAQVEVQPDSAKVLQDLAVVSTSTDARVYETIIQKMHSRDLANRVVFELNLANKPDFVIPAPTFSLRNIFRKIFGWQNNDEFEKLSLEQRTAMAVMLVRDGLSINLQRNTTILNVSFSHPNARFAQEVADQVVLSYINQSVDRKSTTSELARQFIQQKAQEAKTKLQESQKQLVAYAEQEGINQVGEKGSLASDNISKLNENLSETINDRLKIERLVKQIDDGNAAILPGVFESESIQTTKQKIAELRANYQEKLSTFKPSFPEMRRLSAQITELQKQVNVEVSAIASSTRIQYEQLKTREQAIKDEIKELEKQQSADQKKAIRYNILKGEVDSNRAQYESLIVKLNEVGVGAEIQSSDLLIVDQAILPDSPYTPNLKVSLLISVLLGCSLSAGIIFLIEMSNNTFSSPDQIERDLKIPVLGIIPLVDSDDFEEQLKLPHSPISEAYRTLRTSIQFAGVDMKSNLLSVTSGEPSEGKTLTSLRLAEELANLGKKVLLIDADLRRPKMHRMLNKHNNIGLSNLLTNIVQAGKMDPVFQTTHHPNLTFISSGTIPPNPADILASEKMSLMLHFCKKRYDVVIVDCPPVIGLSDAPIITRQADATLLVISAKQVARKSVENAIRRLKMAGANIIGAAMTKFVVEKRDHAYSYRYMSSNYYTYEPGAEHGGEHSDPATPRLEGAKHGGSTTTTFKNGAIASIRNFITDLARKFD